MLSHSLSKKTILITGASSGIGKATATLLASYGVNCILTGRDINRLEAVLNQLEGDNHSVIATDISDISGIDTLSGLVPSNIDGIVHSAGIIQLLPFKVISATAFEKIMFLNLYAPFFLTQKLFKKKKLNDNSSVVFISSISGNIIGSKGNLMYSASKSAVNGMVKVLALELAERKIRVNSVSAGMVKTEMWFNDNMVVSEELLKKDEEKYPLGYGEPIDIASLVTFLVSDAAKWITGSSIVADGGFSIQ